MSEKVSQKDVKHWPPCSAYTVVLLPTLPSALQFERDGTSLGFWRQLPNMCYIGETL